jgi:uncharacterized RDD family membrane protein YckC
MFNRNMGLLDRAIRAALGVVLIPLGLFVLHGAAAVVVTALGVAGVMQGITGFCLLYVPFGFSTLKHEAPSLSR